eukprot:1485408-Rhodomonas_salina.2
MVVLSASTVAARCAVLSYRPARAGLKTVQRVRINGERAGKGTLFPYRPTRLLRDVRRRYATSSDISFTTTDIGFATRCLVLRSGFRCGGRGRRDPSRRRSRTDRGRIAPPIVLRIRYARSDTDVAYAGQKKTDRGRIGPRIVYAFATQCPGGSGGRVRADGLGLSTDYGASCLRNCYAMSGTGRASGATCLCGCYAISGTAGGYGATRCPVLRERSEPHGAPAALRAVRTRGGRGG